LRLAPPLAVAFIIDWSIWRRKHQAEAARAHYKRRHNTQL